MVDFKKKLGVTRIEKKTNPIEIYDLLDRKSETGPLRPAQSNILEQWYTSHQDKKDAIIKLHTGQGKTLIGLLILQSVINAGKGRALYVCPNIYLVEQTFEQAQKFGIKCCLVRDGDLPSEFLNGEQILITHVQKVFNGLTKFKLGTQSLEVATIVLDDSHACIESIKDSLTIRMPNDHPVYGAMLKLFEDDLKSQGEGTFLEILDKQYSSLLPVPYWAWSEKKADVLSILSKHKEDDRIKFTWQLIKDKLETCQCLFSGAELEITPYLIPIWQFGTFHGAKQRILMSATTLDDSFFVKGLSIESEAIEHPLVYKDEKWSGEKMILIPSLIDRTLDRITVLNYFAKSRTKKFGIGVITPSFKKSKLYEDLGCTVAKSDTILKEIKKMKGHTISTPVVFVNRYDGIDLPDDCCRILIIDSMPRTESLSDRYEETRRENSDVVHIRLAQKIEQGLGRSVRGEKDFSAIIIIGPDVVNFIKSNRTTNFFSKQTQKQIEIGFEIAKLATEEITYATDTIRTLVDLINQCLKRDEGWKEFYNEEMNKLGPTEPRKVILDLLKMEKEAEKKFFVEDFEGAAKIAQKIADSFKPDDPEKGWYLQMLARYTHSLRKSESITIQKSAVKSNHGLLTPKGGITYEKLSAISSNRIQRIKEFIAGVKDSTELMLSIEENNSKLSFNEGYDEFEQALKNLGTMLGFLSQRPDKEFKKGPDNLWSWGNNEYVLFECKTEVDEKRKEISKTEASQLNSSIAWFNDEYPEGKVISFMVIHTKSLAKNANFMDGVRIIRKQKLDNLKKNVKSFFMEFNAYDLHNLSDTKIQEFLVTHQLNDIKHMKEIYSEEYYHNKI
jgi:replicative superfamily II helicase